MTESSDDDELHLKMTVAQARAVSGALDLAWRIAAGQIEEIAQLVRAGIVPLNPTAFPNGKASGEQLERIEELLMSVKQEMGHPRNSHLGVGNPAMGVDGSRLYEVGKVIDQALAYHRDPDPQFKGPNFDGLIVRYTQDPAPEATIEPVSAPARKL